MYCNNRNNSILQIIPLIVALCMAACSKPAGILPKPAPIAPKGDKTKMALIPAGTFLMGAAIDAGKDNADERPQHKVDLDAYYIDKYDVTTAEYAACVQDGKCTAPKTDADQKPEDDDCNWGKDDRGNYPVNCVSWTQSKAYCEWAGKRLPTEAEWEKAARGGSNTIWSFGGLEAYGDIDQYAWCLKNNSDRVTYPHTHPVGMKKPNQFGLYDMYGNVGQWVFDVYDENYYKNSPLKNPQGPEPGENSWEQLRVWRGGTFQHSCIYDNSTRRLRDSVDTFSDKAAFRCASNE
jgi:formylglycine-generating enzyme required for sulfatase activity